MSRLHEQYSNQIKDAMMKKFEYSNIMQVPKLEKIVINMGVGEAKENKKVLESAVADLEKIAGQKAVVTRAKKSVANFKLRQEMLRRYYDAQNGAGFDYAYRWPGMNKVLQAAGRVIRTQEDKGVVLLLDDRFAQSEYARLFPKHWRHLEYLRDTKELKKKLAEFWGE